MIYWFQLVVHVLTALSNASTLRVSRSEYFINAIELLVMSCIFFQLYLLIEFLTILGYMRDNHSVLPFTQRSPEVQSFQIFSLCEVLVRIGIVCACCLYMFLRSQCLEKYPVYDISGRVLDYQKKYGEEDGSVVISEHVDFVHGNRITIGTFAVIWAPFFMFFLCNFTNALFEMDMPTNNFAFHWYTISQAIIGVLVIPILFIKGSKYKK